MKFLSNTRYTTTKLSENQYSALFLFSKVFLLTDFRKILKRILFLMVSYCPWLFILLNKLHRWRLSILSVLYTIWSCTRGIILGTRFFKFFFFFNNTLSHVGIHIIPQAYSLKTMVYF